MRKRVVGIIVVAFMWLSNVLFVVAADYEALTDELGEIVVISSADEDGEEGGLSTLAAKPSVALESLTITGNQVAITGKKTLFNAVCTPSNATNTGVVWSISPQDQGATIDSNGKLHIEESCTLKECIVTVTSKEDATISASKVVGINPAKIKSLSITSDGESMIGKTVTLFRKVENCDAISYIDTTPSCTLVGGMTANVAPFEYYSSDEELVTIDENGRVQTTGKGTGTVSIICRATDGTKDKENKILRSSFTVNVVNPVSGIDVTIPANRSLYVAKGKTIQLKSTVKEEYGRVSSKKVKYSSSDKSVATVNGSGLVTMKTDYYAPVTITATSADGSGAAGSIVLYASCPVKNISLGDISYSISKVGYTVLKLSDGNMELPVIFNEPEGAGAEQKKVSPDLLVQSSLPEYMDAVYENGVVTLIPKMVYNKKNIVLTVKTLDGSGYSISWNFRIKE